MGLDRARVYTKKDFLVLDICSSKCRCIPFDRCSVHNDIQEDICSCQDYHHTFHKTGGVSFQMHPFRPLSHPRPFRLLIWTVKWDERDYRDYKYSLKTTSLQKAVLIKQRNKGSRFGIGGICPWRETT